jgi:antitoxin component YwqK of YwqJK toxin-antitoxin module
MKSIRFLSFIFIVSLLASACEEKKEQPQESNEPVSKTHVISFYADSTTVREKYIVLNEDSTLVKYQRFHINGELSVEGVEKNGLRDGLWQAWGEDGNIMTTSYYLLGKANGLKTVYYPNGQKRYEGQIENDERVGEWQFWNAQGELIATENYDSK